jgi:hypothetical protein
MSAVMSGSAAYTSTDECSVDELDAAIGRLVRQMNADSYRMLVLVREFDDRFGWKKWGLKSCAEWLAWRANIALCTAREKVRSAHALRELPAISAAFADGRLSYSKVKALTRVAHLRDEELLLAHALNATVPQVEERCRQIRNVAPESVHDARRAWANRSLSAWRDERRGMLRITVEVPIEEGELIMRALDCAVASGEVTTDVDPDAVAESKSATWRAQQADALVAVMKSYVDGGPGGEGGNTADHYQVVVHADAESLTGGTGRADLPIATVQRLLCDCSLVTVVEDATGKPLDVGRKQRTVSTPLRRALWSRDRGCTFPGCRNVRYIHTHHIRHWADRGETNPDNLTLLCWHHHRLVHEGGFGIRRDANDELYFVRPDGRVIPRSGYRREDMEDDFVDEQPPSSSTEDCQCPPKGRTFPAEEWLSSAEARLSSAEGRLSSAEERPSSFEVREPAAVYRIGARGRRRAAMRMVSG